MGNRVVYDQEEEIREAVNDEVAGGGRCDDDDEDEPLIFRRIPKRNAGQDKFPLWASLSLPELTPEGKTTTSEVNSNKRKPSATPASTASNPAPNLAEQSSKKLCFDSKTKEKNFELPTSLFPMVDNGEAQKIFNHAAKDVNIDMFKDMNVKEAMAQGMSLALQVGLFIHDLGNKLEAKEDEMQRVYEEADDKFSSYIKLRTELENLKGKLNAAKAVALAKTRQQELSRRAEVFRLKSSYENGDGFRQAVGKYKKSEAYREDLMEVSGHFYEQAIKDVKELLQRPDFNSAMLDQLQNKPKDTFFQDWW